MGIKAVHFRGSTGMCSLLLFHLNLVLAVFVLSRCWRVSFNAALCNRIQEQALFQVEVFPLSYFFPKGVRLIPNKAAGSFEGSSSCLFV